MPRGRGTEAFPILPWGGGGGGGQVVITSDPLLLADNWEGKGGRDHIGNVSQLKIHLKIEAFRR